MAALLGELSCNAEACSLFSGTTVADEACELLDYGLASECEPGTRCILGICTPSCIVIPSGGACGYGNPGSCEDSQCILDGDTQLAEGVCEPIPGPGDPCAMVELPCGFDMWCDNGVCSDQFGGEGEECLDQPCDHSQTYCEMDACTALLPDGSPCTRWWYCASGACVGDECVPLPATVGAPCHQEKLCGNGLVCDGLVRTCQEPFESLSCNWQRWCPMDSSTNDTCDEGDGPDHCPPGSDGGDCGYCPDGRQGDGVCDEPGVCAPGTDPDC